MSNQLLPVFAGQINNQHTQLVDARLLHDFLKIGKQFATWITNRIDEYGFIENQDFVIASQNGEAKKGRGGHNKKDFHITLDMGKELGMVERNEKGREIRRYFIECERTLLNLPLIPQEKKTLQSKKGCLTLDQQDTIKNIVRSTAEALPKEQRAKITIRMWSAIKNKYGCTYKEVAENEFNNIISLLARLPIEGELLPKQTAFGQRFILRICGDQRLEQKLFLSSMQRMESEGFIAWVAILPFPCLLRVTLAVLLVLRLILVLTPKRKQKPLTARLLS